MPRRERSRLDDPAIMMRASLRIAARALAVAGISMSLVIVPGAIGQVPALERDGAIEQLKPGQYLWAPQIAPQGPVMVIVNLRTQRAYAYRNGVPIGVSTVSTGKRGHRTPTGVFTILQKEVDHKSNLYDDAPMPYMQRLTWGGIAMHAGDLPGYPASHGCVRLPRAFAKLLFGITKLGLTVVIADTAVVPEVAPVPVRLTAPPPTATGGVDAAFTWRPERSLAGPLSIVISGRDRRLIVLRNGVEIGSSAIAIADPVVATAAFTLTSVDASGFRWLRVRLPGQQVSDAPDMTAAERGRGELPEPFRKLLATALVPGSTMLITRDTLRSGGTGKRLTLIQAGGR